MRSYFAVVSDDYLQMKLKDNLSKRKSVWASPGSVLGLEDRRNSENMSMMNNSLNKFALSNMMETVSHNNDTRIIAALPSLRNLENVNFNSDREFEGELGLQTQLSELKNLRIMNTHDVRRDLDSEDCDGAPAHFVQSCVGSTNNFEMMSTKSPGKSIRTSNNITAHSTRNVRQEVSPSIQFKPDNNNNITEVSDETSFNNVNIPSSKNVKKEKKAGIKAVNKSGFSVTTASKKRSPDLEPREGPMDLQVTSIVGTRLNSKVTSSNSLKDKDKVAMNTTNKTTIKK